MGTTITAGRAVLVDDDALIRSVVRQVLEDSPVEVVAEADSPEDALAKLRETGANIVILDLALRGGTGEDLLRAVRRHDDDIHVVVYSAYAADPKSLLEAGAAAVVEKPDFARLGAAIDGVAAAMGVPVDRRRPGTEAGLRSAPTGLSLSGFEPWESFLSAVDAATAGDSILCADVVAGALASVEWDDVFTTDHRLALGRAIARTLRVQDRVSVTPTGRPVALLIAGHPEAPTSVFGRIRERWTREVDIGRLVGAFGMVHEGEDGLDRLVAVEQAVTDDGGNPLRMV